MRSDWSTLKQPAPTALVEARKLAHHAIQWATRAARANLPAVPDDSHTVLAWDPEQQALVSQAFAGGVRVGLRIGSMELLFIRPPKAAEIISLQDASAGGAGKWLDSRLEGAALKPARPVKLPYEVAAVSFSGAAKQSAATRQLGRWFAAAAEVLEEFKAQVRGGQPSPVVCWPHHFDMATVVSLTKPDTSVGIGISPGDEYYAQPYAYVSPYPRPAAPRLPELPPGGHWHTKDFLGAVAVAGDILPLRDARAAMLVFIRGAFDSSKEMLERG
jgi:hypothetical protein